MDNKQFETLFGRFSGIALIFDESEKILLANNTFCEFLGYSQNEILKLSIDDIISMDDKSQFLDMLSLDYYNHDITVKFYHKNGAYRYFSIKTYNLSPNIMLFGSSIKRDYSGFEYTEELKNSVDTSVLDTLKVNDIGELFNSKTLQLRLIFDSMPFDIWVKDSFHRYVYMNKSLIKHSHVDEENYYLKDDFDIYDNDIANEFLASDQSAIDLKKMVQFTFEANSQKILTWSEVMKIPIYNDNGNNVGLIGIALDISDYKRLESNLNEKIERLEFILKNIHGAVVQIDHKGDILYASGQIVKALGITPTHKNLFEYYAQFPENSELIMNIKTTLNGMKTETIYQRNNTTIKLSCFPVLDNSGNNCVIGYATIL